MIYNIKSGDQVIFQSVQWLSKETFFHLCAWIYKSNGITFLLSTYMISLMIDTCPFVPSILSFLGSKLKKLKPIGWLDLQVPRILIGPRKIVHVGSANEVWACQINKSG